MHKKDAEYESISSDSDSNSSISYDSNSNSAESEESAIENGRKRSDTSQWEQRKSRHVKDEFHHYSSEEVINVDRNFRERHQRKKRKHQKDHRYREHSPLTISIERGLVDNADEEVRRIHHSKHRSRSHHRRHKHKRHHGEQSHRKREKHGRTEERDEEFVVEVTRGLHRSWDDDSRTSHREVYRPRDEKENYRHRVKEEPVIISDDEHDVERMERHRRKHKREKKSSKHRRRRREERIPLSPVNDLRYDPDIRIKEEPMSIDDGGDSLNNLRQYMSDSEREESSRNDERSNHRQYDSASDRERGRKNRKRRRRRSTSKEENERSSVDRSGTKKNQRAQIKKEEPDNSDEGNRGSNRDRNKQPNKNERTQWGKPEEVKKEKDDAPQEKVQPNMGLSGKLTEDANKFNGVVIKYTQPPEARKPKRRWRWYIFKGEEELPFLPLHRQSAYLIGRDRKVCDIPTDHPSCSKQHAVMQYRLVPFVKQDGSSGKTVKPFLIDLDSANGTFINNRPMEKRRYYELLEKDVVKFGFSSREYILLHEGSKDDDITEADLGVVEELSPVSLLRSK